MLKSQKILIVDDEESLRCLMRRRFESEGFDCITAESGLDALEKAKEETPDLVILDLCMPGMDGLQTYREIREIPECLDTKVMVFSAKDPDLLNEIGYLTRDNPNFVFLLKTTGGREIVSQAKRLLSNGHGYKLVT